MKGGLSKPKMEEEVDTRSAYSTIDECDCQGVCDCEDEIWVRAKHVQPPRSALRTCCWLVAWCVAAVFAGVLIPELVNIRKVRRHATRIFYENVLGRAPLSVSMGAGIGNADIKAILRYQYGHVDCFITDNDYALPSIETVQTFLDSDTTSSLQYEVNRNDCDDFSAILQGKLRSYEYVHGGNLSYAFGQGFGPLKTDDSSGHAFNFFIADDRLLYIVEPQTATVFTPDEFDYRINSVFV